MQRQFVHSLILVVVGCLLWAILGSEHVVDGAKEPICAYRNAEDETIFLKYLPLLRKGQDYVDFGKNGKCLRRAICSDTFKIDLEECDKQKISCANKDRYPGVFPACCIKC